MLVLISPAKNLDYTSEVTTEVKSVADLLTNSEKLMNKLSTLRPAELESLMKISPKLADLNYERNQEWNVPFNPKKSKQAAFAFNGEVYNGLNISSFNVQEMDYAQNHLRILSGLYGLLRPLDAILPYRLEMGTKFPNNEMNKNLYSFWGSLITEKVNALALDQNANTIVNLASTEYFKVIKPKEVKPTIITPVFKDWKIDKHKVIMMYAKKARGLMTSFILKNEINQEEQLKTFNSEGYLYNEELSKGNDWVFTRG
tara:strand:- start:1461 stop:2231 length:771 start_codon:yes stop_codon:yes gene_type:complete